MSSSPPIRVTLRLKPDKIHEYAKESTGVSMLDYEHRLVFTCFEYLGVLDEIEVRPEDNPILMGQHKVVIRPNSSTTSKRFDEICKLIQERLGI